MSERRLPRGEITAPENGLVPVLLRLPADLHQRIKALAYEQDTHRSVLLRRYIELGMTAEMRGMETAAAHAATRGLVERLKNEIPAKGEV